MLTGCSWEQFRAKFTGEDLSGVTGSAIEIEDYDAEECVTVPEYKGVEVDCSVSDEELEAEINSFLAENSSEKKVKKGKCKEGDSVNIDFVGKIDGEAFDNGSATDQTITLGASGYIPGFDDGVIGMKVGETKDIDVTFPEDYGNEELNGKPAVFTITLNYISETVTPKLTDKLVAKTTDYKTADEYKESVQEKLKQEKKDAAGETAYAEIEEKAEVKKYPETLVESCKLQLDAYYKYMATQQYGYSDFKSFLDAVQMSQEAYEETLLTSAQSIAKTQLLTEAIAARENISVTDEEVAAEIASIAQQSGQEESVLRENFTGLYENAITIERYYNTVLLSNKVIDLIGENVKIVEE